MRLGIRGWEICEMLKCLRAKSRACAAHPHPSLPP